jgi:hypothetical protein
MKKKFIASNYIPSADISEKLKIRNSSFFPIKNLRTKTNYKEYFIIEKDGKILRRIFLNIFDSENRELLIFRHYISRRIKFFYKSSVGLNILSRDKPWDFKIELSSKESLNVEITSISDNQWNFELLSNEERCATASQKENIPFHELIKINKLFPDETLEKIIEKYHNNKTSKKKIIPNPFYNKSILTIGRNEYPEKKLSEIINLAILKKENKKHFEKEKTILIIDNRTFTLEIEDFQKSLQELGQRFELSPFMEIWLYTGYYSSNDGNDAEYNLIPIKVSENQREILNKMAIDTEIIKNGILYT